jgi:hypothetical protein
VFEHLRDRKEQVFSTELGQDEEELERHRRVDMPPLYRKRSPSARADWTRDRGHSNTLANA